MSNYSSDFPASAVARTTDTLASAGNTDTADQIRAGFKGLIWQPSALSSIADSSRSPKVAGQERDQVLEDNHCVVASGPAVPDLLVDSSEIISCILLATQTGAGTLENATDVSIEHIYTWHTTGVNIGVGRGRIPYRSGLMLPLVSMPCSSSKTALACALDPC